MKTVFALLLFFLCVGLFTRAYTTWTRLLLLGGIGGSIVLFYFVSS